jgi:hypothetical protein
VEHFYSHLPETMMGLLSIVGSVLAWLLRKAIKEIRSLGETKMQAELAYEEVSQRVPEVKMKYEFWKAHR